MVIQVKQEHIDAGKPNNGYLCPVALAIQSQCEPTRPIWIGGGIIDRNVDDVSPSSYIGTPYVVAEFIMRFDGFLPVQPFEFELPVDCSWFKE